jgi:hypothetical protein
MHRPSESPASRRETPAGSGPCSEAVTAAVTMPAAISASGVHRRNGPGEEAQMLSTTVTETGSAAARAIHRGELTSTSRK